MARQQRSTTRRAGMNRSEDGEARHDQSCKSPNPRSRSRRAAAFNLKQVNRAQRCHRLSVNLRPRRNSRTGLQQDGFETVPKARAELRRRLASLRRFLRVTSGQQTGAVQECERVVAELAAALRGRDPGSLADPLFMREVRDRVLSAIVAALAPLSQRSVTMVTLVANDWRVAGDRLDGFEPRKLLESARAHLQRAGLARLTGWAILFVHGEYDNSSDSFVPHIHAVVVGRKIEAFDAVRRLPMFSGGAGKPIYRPVWAGPLRNVDWQVSYLLQGFWPAKPGDPNAERSGGRGRRRHRIPEPRHAEWLLWLHRQRLTDLAWFHGIGWRDGRLTPTNKALALAA